MIGEKEFLLLQVMDKTDFNEEELISELNKATDWVQISPKSWLIWTRKDPVTWHNRVRKALRGSQNCLVFKADMSIRAGRMPSSFWDFVRNKLSPPQR